MVVTIKESFRVANIDYGLCVRPCLGEFVSGDAAVAVEFDDGMFLAIVDVLGHGSAASELANTISTWLTEHASSDLIPVMTRLHSHIKGTRGAAVGLAFVQPDSGRVNYVGIGNTTIRLFGDTANAKYFSRDGILGQHLPTPKLQEGFLVRGDVLLLYTDGIRSYFSINEYPRLLTDAAGKIARTVVDRFGKDHDDAACLALRCER